MANVSILTGAPVDVAWSGNKRGGYEEASSGTEIPQDQVNKQPKLGLGVQPPLRNSCKLNW